MIIIGCTYARGDHHQVYLAVMYRSVIVKARSKPGWAVHRADAGHVAVTLHYSADPAKNTMAWANARRRAMPDEPSFLQEYEISWTSAGGNPVFPEAANNILRYVEAGIRPCTDNDIFRGWDFGARNPAVVWGQVVDGQVVILRELVPPDMDVHSQCQLTQYLSGQIEEVTLPRAIQWLEVMRASKPWFPEGDPGRRDYPIPWFKGPTRFRDFSGPEVTQPTTFETTKGERSASEVLANAGIYVEWNATPQSYGENIIRRLLLDMPDGRPGLIIHPSCTTLIEGLGGALSWAKPTRTDPRPNKIARKPGYIDCYDAFRYMVINMADVVARVNEYERRLDGPHDEGPGIKGRGWPGEDEKFHGIEYSEVKYGFEGWLD